MMSKTSIVAWIGVMFILVIVPAIIIQNLIENSFLTILGTIILTIFVVSWILSGEFSSASAISQVVR